MMRHQGWAILEVVHALGLNRGGGCFVSLQLHRTGDTPRVHSAGALGRAEPH